MKKSFSIVVAMIQWVCVSTSFAALIHDAVDAGNLAEVTRLIAEDRANLEARDQFNETPLHFAAMNGHVDIVQALLASGANIEARDKFDATPLHVATWYCHTAIVQVLIAAGADVNARDQYGDTARQIAQQPSRAAIATALQPEAVAQLHTQTADAHTTAGNHRLAARSHTWAANALPGTEEARGSYTRTADSFRAASAAVFNRLSFFFGFSSSIPITDAARVSHTRAAGSFTLAGDYGAAAESYDLAGNHARAAESHTQHAHAQVAAGDYASAVEHYRLSHGAHTRVGNHDSAQLSQAMINRYAPIVDGERHAQTMKSHFETAMEKAGEMQSHRERGDEAAALLAETQAAESLESADRSAEEAVAAFEAALTALDDALEGAMTVHEQAQVANAPAEHLAQHAATVDLLRAHIEGVSRKIEETRESAAAGHERVSAARGN